MSFLWHGSWLALAQSFMDVDTVIPAMILSAGGNSLHIGILSTIMIGGANFAQLFFAPLISNKPYKKKYLILGISLRIISLLILSILLYSSTKNNGNYIIWVIFIIMTIFSFGGSYANISYTDILGKSINQTLRKKYFSIKQVVNGAGVIISAILVKQIISMNNFPINYSIMFLIGGISLLVASIGFWNIKESIKSNIYIKNIKHFFVIVKEELSQNNKLKYFLGFVNTQGISMSFLPFIMYYSKDIFHTDSSNVGTYLIFKVSGVITVGLIVLFLNKFIRYRNILKINILLSILIAVLLVLIPHKFIIDYIFLIGGAIISLYSISMRGILLEISNSNNRAIYAGIAGAGNILPIIFPLVGGWLIHNFDFNIFLALYASIIIIAYYFILKLDCQK